MKIDNKTKRMIKSVAECLPVYYEPYIENKFINHKDILTNEFLSEDELKKDAAYTAKYRSGKRLVDSKLHFKRMCKAWKKGGEDEYKSYLVEFSKKKFKRVSWIKRFINKLFK